MKAVKYDRNDVFDTIVAEGAGVLLSKPAKQAWYSRTFWNGDDLCPADTSIGGSTGLVNVCSMEHFTAATGMTTGNYKKIHSTHLTYRIVSASLNLIKLTVYIVRANTHASNFPQVTWPEYAFNEACAKIPGFVDPEQIGANPYQTPAFGTLWKIIKRRNYVLNPGQAVNMTVHTNEHMKFNHHEQGFDTILSGQWPNIVKGRTYGVMFCLSGFPMSGETTDGGVTKNFVCASRAKIHFTWNWRVKYTDYANQQKGIQRLTNSYDPQSQLPEPNDMAIVNDDSGNANVGDHVAGSAL